MKIFSDLSKVIVNAEQGEIPLFALCVDTQKTGNENKDSFCAGADFSSMQGVDDPDKILEFLIPILTNLIYTAYGQSPSAEYKKPITDYHATGFDPKCVNGVKGCEIKY